MLKENRVRRLAGWLQSSRRTVALTGAGVSTDSGIPDFRGPDGLWGEEDPLKVASLKGLVDEPRRFYQFWADKLGDLQAASPNISHKTLAKLESEEILDRVITQNIDGLHTEAGSRGVLEIHGNCETSSCMDCGKELPTHEILDSIENPDVPTCPDCGGPLRPNVVLFGEEPTSDFDLAVEEMNKSDLLLILGTSLEVNPAASLIPEFKAAGGRSVQVDKAPPTRDEQMIDLYIQAELSSVMETITRFIPT